MAAGAALFMIVANVAFVAGSAGAGPSSVAEDLEAKLVAMDGAELDAFGGSVSVSGDTAIISSQADDDKGTDSGSAYVYTRSGTTWTQQAKLVPTDGAADDAFGFSVSVSGDTAIIGSHRDDDKGSSSGSAYVFTRSGTTWTQQAKLVPTDGAAGDAFGVSVAVSGDTAIIGSYSDDEMGTDSGSAYVYTRSGTTWTQQAKLVPTDGAGHDRFGISVSVDGDTAVVSSYLDDDKGTDSGSAYVYTRSGTTWSQQAKLVPTDGDVSDFFGWSVSVNGDTAVVGSFFDDDQGSSSGSAYVFTRSGTTWTEQAKLVPTDGAADDHFGHSVSVDGDAAMIGSPRDDDKGSSSGSAYVYTRSGSTWTEQAKLVPTDGAEFDLFGWAVSLSGDTTLIGSRGDDDKGSSSGSAYVYAPDVGIGIDLGTACSGGEEVCKSATAVDEDGDGLIEVGEYVTFHQTLTLDNAAGPDWSDAVLKDNFGAEVHVTTDPLAPSQGSAEVTTANGKSAKERLTWDVGDVATGAGASLELDAENKLDPGGFQTYTECGVHEYNSGATLKVSVPGTKKPRQQSFETGAILVTVWTENQLGDCDEDGVSDAQELIDGTDPFDAGDFPA